MTNEDDSAGSEVGGGMVFGAGLAAGRLAVGSGAGDEAVTGEGVTSAVEPELLDEPHPASATAVRLTANKWRLCMHVPSSHQLDAREIRQHP